MLEEYMLSINFTESQMQAFINDGNWRTRSTGRELNFGKDSYRYREISKGTHCITIFKSGMYQRWVNWLRTVGDIIRNEKV